MQDIYAWKWQSIQCQELERDKSLFDQANFNQSHFKDTFLHKSFNKKLSLKFFKSPRLTCFPLRPQTFTSVELGQNWGITESNNFLSTRTPVEKNQP